MVCREIFCPAVCRVGPVGAKYVVEGNGGEEGNLRVIARYVVLPGGRLINIPADLIALRLAGWAPPRNRHAPTSGRRDPSRRSRRRYGLR
jgi:hypothetical protein